MNADQYTKIVCDDAPGERRAALIGRDGRAAHLFLQRWRGRGEAARYGSVHRGRIRSFEDDLSGAFLELDSGEEVFLRIKSRRDLTEGADVAVEIAAEARSDKLARGRLVTKAPTEDYSIEDWAARFTPSTLDVEHDGFFIDAAIDEALALSVTLSEGGRLHIERTRALTALDIDTAGRTSKGSAGARALAINKDAASEMARQAALRGIAGNLVLDCVEPLNRKSNELLHQHAQNAFKNAGFETAKVLPPSALGLMQVSLNWSICPLEDRLDANPRETTLLALMRQAGREARTNSSALYRLELSEDIWRAYLARKNDADTALAEMFGGRIQITQSSDSEDRIVPR